jgi:Fe-Mn family superoxide dismutase
MFQLTPLPFAENALEPLMSRDTLNTHHGKHHAGYIKKTNAALAEKPNAPKRLEDVVRLAAREKEQKLFNNAAQAWNHGFFWQSLSPDGGGTPQGELAKAIDQGFGSYDAFRRHAALHLRFVGACLLPRLQERARQIPGRVLRQAGELALR